MTNQITVDNGSVQTAPVSGAYKVDVSRGTTNGSVSAQWARRPTDQRFLSLDDLADVPGDEEEL